MFSVVLKMFFLNRLNLLLLFINGIYRCFASLSPRITRKEVNEALATGIRFLNLDSDDEDDTNQRTPVGSSLSKEVDESFSDDEDEVHDAGSSGASSRLSSKFSFHRQPSQFTLSDSESDDEPSFQRERFSATSGV